MSSGVIYSDAVIGGIAFQLFVDRGLYWPQKRVLFVADTHFGKDATFRRFGIGVPTGSTDTTLGAIDRMIDASGASRVVILGDMFHARSSLSVPTRRSLEAFFEGHRDVRFTLIRGNHDAHVGRLPATWPMEILDPGHMIDNLILNHEPGQVPRSASLMLCGHLHPAVRVGTGTDHLGKIACFWLSERCLVLPAIGDFTGTHVVRPTSDDRAWLVTEDQVIEHRFG